MMWIKETDSNELEVVHEMLGVVKRTDNFFEACNFITNWPDEYLDPPKDDVILLIDLVE